MTHTHIGVVSMSVVVGRISVCTILFAVVLANFPAFVSSQVTCQVSEVLGCYSDEGDGKRPLNFTAATGNAKMSQEFCASLCDRFGFTLNAVEFRNQCYCGDGFDPNHIPQNESMSECQAMKCAGDNDEFCGGRNRMIVYKAICKGNQIPNGHACLDPNTTSLPFCDPKLPISARVTDLISRLQPDEKYGLMGPDPSYYNCFCRDFGVPRLGIPSYMNLVETNTAVSAGCVMEEKCSTVFTASAGLAASFNRSLWHIKGEVISREIRAYNNMGWHRSKHTTNDKDIFPIGLSGFGPNINIVRDPRFGRNCELPSEDPFLSGSYAKEYVTGCQDGTEDPKFKKMVAGLKHYDAYSVETNRMSFNGNISTFDLFDTYLPQYYLGFVKGGALLAMCSYASINGVPSCANDFLLNKMVREKWNCSNVVVGSDCTAVSNMYNKNHYAKSEQDAAAKALNGGCDIELGSTYFTSGVLKKAVSSNMTDMVHVDAALHRIMTNRFITGQFDSLDDQPYTKYKLESINSTEHQQINLDGALQSFILLKNDLHTLPLAAGKRIAVVGPHAISRHGLLEDYAGDMQCYDNSDDCIPTIGEWVSYINNDAGGTTEVQKGVDINSKDQSHINAAISAVSAADEIVMCLGIDTTIEKEGLDRTSITLPGLQETFAQEVIAAAGSKPLVLVLVSGGIVAIDDLVEPLPAIVQTFYPAIRGAEALAQTLFGQSNRWGKLPVTIYPANYIKQVGMNDMSLTKGVGRTYRYYNGTALFPFGFGLSYVNFSLQCSCSNNKAPAKIVCSVKNLDNQRAGDEVLMVYHRVDDGIKEKVDHPVPAKALIDFSRVSLAPGKTASVTFEVTADALKLTDNDGNLVLYPGTHFVDVSRGYGDVFTHQLTV